MLLISSNYRGSLYDRYHIPMIVNFGIFAICVILFIILDSKMTPFLFEQVNQYENHTLMVDGIAYRMIPESRWYFIIVKPLLGMFVLIFGFILSYLVIDEIDTFSGCFVTLVFVLIVTLLVMFPIITFGVS